MIEVNKNAKLSKTEVGGLGLPVFIFDDLCLNLNDFRKLLFNKERRRSLSSSLPASIIDLNCSMSVLFELFQDKLSKEYQYPFLRRMQKAYMDLAIFDFSKKESVVRQASPHFDTSFLAGVLYLNKNESGGLGFYVNKISGLEFGLSSKVYDYLMDEKRPNNCLDYHFLKESGYLQQAKDALSRGGAKNYGEFYDMSYLTSFEESDYLGEENLFWKQIDYIPMKENRLVIYPAFLYHTGVFDDDFIGEEVAEKRSIMRMFFPF